MQPTAFLPEQVIRLCDCTTKDIWRLSTRQLVSSCGISVPLLKLHLYPCLHMTKDTIWNEEDKDNNL